jgi:hypothetical protein
MGKNIDKGHNLQLHQVCPTDKASLHMLEFVPFHLFYDKFVRDASSLIG